MDLRLPLLADANLHLGVSEEALSEGHFVTAGRELEKAQAALDELREIWPEMGQTEQGLMTAMAKPLSVRARRIEVALPKIQPLSEAEPVEDPEQDEKPQISG